MNYINDKKDVIWKEWDKAGTIVINGTFRKGIKWEGDFSGEYYSDGKKALKTKGYYDTGELKSAGLKIREKKLGEWTYWYKSGAKKETGFYHDGQKIGEWEGWYYNGQRYFKRNYESGKQDGEWIMWYDNGEKKYLGEYKNGKKEGQWFEWDQNNELVVNGHYKNGLKWDGNFKDEIYVSGSIKLY